MATATTKRPFLNTEVGKNVEGDPFAFHLEGLTASKTPHFSEASEGKDAFLGISIGVGMAADALLARAKGEYNKEDKDKYTMSEFVSLRIYGKQAEELSAIYTTGIKIAVSGKLSLRDYQKNDGTPAQEVTCDVKKLVVMGGKTTEPKLTDSIGTATYVYKDKSGTDRSIRMAQLLTGTVVGEPKLRESNGKKFFNFGIKTALPAAKVYDLANGLEARAEYGNKTITNITVFDKQAEALSRIISAGAQVVASGPVQEREYNGNVSYSMNARALGIMKLAPLPANETNAAAGPAPVGTAAAAAAEAAAAAAAAVPNSSFVDLGTDDEEGELPF